MTKPKLVIKLAASLLITSCASLQQPAPGNLADAFPQKAPQSPSNGSPAAPTIPVPEFKIPPATARYELRHPLNVSVHEVDARDFFMGLVVDSDDNMVVHPDVKGTISLELKNVSIPQVLDAVQKVYGYDYKKTEIGYVIYPSTLQTRAFKIDRLDLLRQGKSNTFVSSGQTGNSSQAYGNQQNQNLTQPFNNNQPNNGSMTGMRSSGSSITTTTETDFWKELDEALRTLIAVDKDATVVINKQSGVVIARAKPMQLREIESFLATTQNQISRQVILEAKILEVVLNDSHQDGVEWKSIIRQGLQIAPGVATGGVYTLAANAGSFQIGDFTAVVTLLESQGKTNVLSSPRISTLNNQQAIIKVGQDETFVTGISPGIVVSSGISGGTVQPAPILSAFFSGIALDVTPQINDGGDITLHIHPSITKVESKDREYKIDGFGSTSVVPTALSTIRESDSIVKAENGQIIVLGGLMQDNTNENKEGVYGLSRIPYLGNLFRLDKGSSQKTELVILLKASLINSNADWQNDIDASQKRVRELDAQPRWQ
ncbi:MAG: secretin N-terminal domain-containing protein [Methylococcaceae bacterium]|nr:secretin N-terminal domain-containing protein [Methylococcaceae bacterium]MDP2394977.1 secretin N-terminal domain-containing protein [Methylococcaceae bacterium]MDP3019503.1 secretin N-terminal domain-containing protein [Methylococcaceae bacterium]MDP3389493.1 secretin N-terminal domain-containing protein [Methylococcaceae bacterium]MDP3931990.1 secretin N-terminal domain-containing protein [Methylococcaceae bacterium]